MFLAIVAVSPIASVYASQSTTLAAPIIVDKTLKPGSTFSINITIANVTSMLGYQFVLSYDTTVLSATGYSSYLPFDYAWPSKISDAEGYAAVAYTTPFPEYIGFEAADPVPIARIDFTVDARGSSLLDVHSTVLSNIYGEMVPHDVVDGFFANIHVQTPNIPVTSVTAETRSVNLNSTSPQMYSIPSFAMESQSTSNKDRWYAGVDLTETFSATGISSNLHIYENYVISSPHWIAFHIALVRTNATHMEWLEAGFIQNRSNFFQYPSDFYLYVASGIKNLETRGVRGYVENSSLTVPLTDHFLEITETTSETFEARIDSGVLTKTHTFSIYGDRVFEAEGESTYEGINSLRGHFWNLKYYDSNKVSHVWRQVHPYETYPTYLVGLSGWTATDNFYTWGGGVSGDINGDREVDATDVSHINAYFYDVFWSGGVRYEIIGPAGRYDSNADINPEIVPDERVNIFDAALINANWGRTA